MAIGLSSVISAAQAANIQDVIGKWTDSDDLATCALPVGASPVEATNNDGMDAQRFTDVDVRN
jgi:hypothetical protein